ncbi:TetR/AcrR family transcriptional regulator [Thermobifida alba]|uniref:TetR/AcrR family transcriptional regulator n=1 Tax=Thermobifida alba TaxID=53522 RepID=A0ABY4KWI9_THEAE|nr:TetR/AcrR family transcriptional regulator [Thermobifida alba]UPT19807.1 TetR/AcrR family transcriptional regulator [Thermobifida alba]
MERNSGGGDRRSAILRAAAELFAARGFRGVSIEDLGRAVGTTGPALYRHFRGKEALLAEVLLDVSERLLHGGAARVAGSPGPEAALDALLRGHIAFALDEPALITVHDRELRNVPPEPRHRIRRLQRAYVEQWVAVLAELRPGVAEPVLRTAVHAMFGLLNSTPHSAGELDRDRMAELLFTMARTAVLAVGGRPDGAFAPPVHGQRGARTAD